MKSITVSIIIPCLNEEKAVARCVGQIKNLSANRRIKNYKFEIIVVDNGSTDRTAEVAKKAGAKVIKEERKGYGRAIRTGMEKAKGEYLIFADGDGSYDFSETPKFLEKLIRTSPQPSPRGEGGNRKLHLIPSPLGEGQDEVFDLVIGSRFLGKIQKGAMPFLHRYFATPAINLLFKIFFHLNFSDVNSGFRGMTRKAFDKLRLKTTGMEFASEMLYKAGKLKMKIAEVPIIYHKRIGASKLSAFRDAWRHVKFLLLFSPDWLFLVPGCLFWLFGVFGVLGLSLGPVQALGRSFDIHSMITSSFATLIGFQIMFLGLFAKVFANNYLFEEDKKIVALMKNITLEKGLMAGFVIFIIGLLGFSYIVVSWWSNNFGSLSMERLLIFSLTFLVLGLEIIFSSFFFGIIGREER